MIPGLGRWRQKFKASLPAGPKPAGAIRPPAPDRQTDSILAVCVTNGRVLRPHDLHVVNLFLRLVSAS